MLISTHKDIVIKGIAAAVSTKWTSVEELVGDDDLKMVRKFIKNTGVKGRYDVGIRQTTSDFCYAAATQLMKEKNVSPASIGILVFVTQSADYSIPATACLLQDRLGMSKDTIAFDVNLGCSGYVYGLNMVAGLMNSSNISYALLLCGDTSAKEGPKNKEVKHSNTSKLLFGNAGTATLLCKEPNGETIPFVSRTDGSGFRRIIYPYGGMRHPNDDAPDRRVTRYDDMEIFNFTIDEVPIMLKELMDTLGKTPDDYDSLALHQANRFIIQQVGKRAGFTDDKIIVSLDKYGNTSSASIPLSLVDRYGEVNDNKRISVLACGFGIGLSWAATELRIDPNDILPIIHTDEYFDDGYPFDE